MNVWVLPLFGDRKAFPFLPAAPFSRGQGRISPDGKWVAFTTNEFGQFQIVVQSFPDPNGGKWQISPSGGIHPMWRSDGRELYYLAPDGKLMAVSIKGGDSLGNGMHHSFSKLHSMDKQTRRPRRTKRRPMASAF